MPDRSAGVRREAIAVVGLALLAVAIVSFAGNRRGRVVLQSATPTMEEGADTPAATAGPPLVFQFGTPTPWWPTEIVDYPPPSQFTPAPNATLETLDHAGVATWFAEKLGEGVMPFHTEYDGDYTVVLSKDVYPVDAGTLGIAAARLAAGDVPDILVILQGPYDEMPAAYRLYVYDRINGILTMVTTSSLDALMKFVPD